MTGLWLIIYGLLCYPLVRVVLRFLKANHIVAQNFRNETIPVSTGLYFVVLALFYLIWLRIGERIGLDAAFSAEIPFTLFAIFVSIVFFVGWLDDSVGDRSVKGFKGHIRKWREEKVVTTGLLKAVSIALVSLWAVWEMPAGSSNGMIVLLTAVMQWLLMTLSANALNLFDLRPGRALKLAALILLLVILFGTPASYLLYIVPIGVGIVWLFPSDARGGSMLGDAGANLIGFALGFSVAASCPLWLQFVLTIALVWIHWLAERYSISRYIESKPFLRLIDTWGN